MTSNSAFNIQHSALAEDDLLWRQLKTIPAFRGLLRAVEARFYQQLDLAEPILDLGCGDGHFSQMTFERPLTVGIDPWWGPLKKAQKSEMYQHLLQGLGDQMPFPDGHFATVISNSVLEHIPGIQAVLFETNRVLQPGGQLVITMPSHLFTQNLGGAQFFEKLGANSLADQYRRFFNFISRHAHTDSAEVWQERLALAGFAIERWQYYFSAEALHALEWGHVQGLPSAILHAITGHWILAPYETSLQRTERWVRPFYEEPFPEKGTYIFIVARKQSDGPIEAELPPARPFTIEELETRRLETGDYETTKPETTKLKTARLKTARLETRDYEPVNQPPAANRQQPVSSPQSPVSTPRLSPRLLTGSLILASLLCALTGQSILGANPPEPAAGLRWYGYSLIPLLILAVWQGRMHWKGLPQWQRPSLTAIPRQRWYYLLAFFLAFLAANFGSSAHPTIAILLWLAAGGIAFYALQKRHELRMTYDVSRFTLIASAALFFAALIIRAVNLTSLPFILDGTEASIGLDLLSVRDGLLQNPFATGWLTNPTLPYFLLVWPIKLLGPSVLSIRLLSPLVGALTVAATFLIGQRLWGREVGLIAAVLLLGSSFHLQYSRIGLTNVWDSLLALLALGLLGIAWQNGKSANGRSLWLLAGTAVGLNAYFFIGGHLMPLILVVLFGSAILFQRETIGEQWPHILAAALMALVIALPQLLYYNNNPTVFMERFNSLSILGGQTGWLGQEAARLGISQGALLRRQIVDGLLSFTYGLDKSGSYRPERPLLGLGTAVIFTLGTIFAIVRLKQFRYSLLLGWLFVSLIFGSALLLESPSSHRLVIAAPAVALLAAVGLVEIGRLIEGVKGRKGEGVITPSPLHPFTLSFLPVLLAVTMLLALQDISFYFGAYRQQHSFADRNTEIANAMADYLNNLGPDWTAYFYGPPSMYVGFPTIPFLVQDFSEGTNLFDVNTPPEDTLTPAPTLRRTFIFLPERSNELEQIRGMFANGRLQTVSGFHADPLFYVYEVTQ
ncbi:MAG: methyltransferase domain-containing protein [Ardenticatenaceae bacterium]|nr:methyltransferase domain-containing protein [Ardenticatenaceae bacterium]